MSELVTIYPNGVRADVPCDVCRCPVLTVGDACPVHQQIPTMSTTLGRGMAVQAAVDASLPPMRTLHFTPEEILVLATALAASVNSETTPADATEAAALVWNSEEATVIQRSLATALAEAY